MRCGQRLRLGWWAAACCFMFAWPLPSRAYITDHPQTLGGVAAWSTYIMVVRVEKVSQEKRVVIYRKVRDLKGKFPKDEVKHVFNKSDPPANEPGLFRLNAGEWSYVLQWAEPGKEAVILALDYPGWGYYSHVYIDQCWYGNYCPEKDWIWWHTLYSRPDMLRNWCCGSPARLAAVLERVVAGKEAVVPVLAEGEPADLRLGRAKVRGLKTSLKIKDFDAKRDAADWADDPKLVEALVRQVKGEDRGLRLKGARGLEQWFGPEVKAAGPALIEAVRDGEGAIRKVAAAALANRFLDSRTAVTALEEVLKDKDRDVRVKAAEALGAWGEKGRAAVPALTEALKDKDGGVAEAGAVALIRIDSDSEGKTPAISEALQRKASVGGRYRKLLQRVKVPQELGISPFQDRAAIVGLSPPVPEYLGHKDLPGGYWVYVFPYWYVWGEQAGP
jgi:HEAT repeats